MVASATEIHRFFQRTKRALNHVAISVPAYISSTLAYHMPKHPSTVVKWAICNSSSFSSRSTRTQPAHFPYPVVNTKIAAIFGCSPGSPPPHIV